MIVFGLAGSAFAVDEPGLLDATAGDVRHAGHLYFNIATGERLLTLIDQGDVQQGAAGAAGDEIWIVGGGAPCADFGSSTSFFFAVDVFSGTSGRDPSPILFDWGDIASDTVVDCVQIHWITDHADTDTNSDSVGDGVEGFGATWTFWDGMNGRSPQLESIAEPIIELTFFDLPGEYPVDTATIAFYTADIDLGGTSGSSLTFEIGDTDSDLQGAAVHNPRMDLRDEDSDSIPDIDPDGDGLADWGWSIDFHQPGTVDFDNADGDSDTQTGVDGDPLAFATAGVVFGMAWPGHAEYDSANDTWDWVLDGPTAGANEDSFGLLEFGSYTGPWWFGGFRCDPYVPAADFAIVLYQVDDSVIECADLAGNPDGSPDGLLNFLDISAFLALFSQGDLSIDLAGNPDGSPDGVLNFFDVSAYLALYAAGCP